jgi:hypothetical protein
MVNGLIMILLLLLVELPGRKSQALIMWLVSVAQQPKPTTSKNEI